MKHPSYLSTATNKIARCFFAATKNARITKLFCTTSVLLVSACAQQEQKSVSAADLKQESLKVIAHVIDIQTLLETCRQIGPDAGDSASQAYNAWQQQFWPVVVGADRAYYDLLSASSFEFQERTISLEALNYFSSSHEKAQSRHKYLQFSRGDRGELCAGKMDFSIQSLTLSEDTYQRLAEYGLQHQHPPTPSDRIPTLAGDMRLENTIGRSFYKLEQQLISQGCSNTRILTLKNEWPKELYAAFCDMTGEVMSCTWGNCLAVKSL